MTKHIKKSKQSFEYGIAAYPVSFKEYVISPQKICIQFNDVQCKTRPLGKEYSQLKTTPWGTREMPIDTQGTTIDTLAVGIPLGMYKELLSNIYTAIQQHSELYPEHSIKSEIQEIFNDQ